MYPLVAGVKHPDFSRFGVGFNVQRAGGGGPRGPMFPWAGGDALKGQPGQPQPAWAVCIIIISTLMIRPGRSQ